MSNFNLESALQGEPVLLRDGSKAYVIADLSMYAPKLDSDIPINGTLQGISGGSRNQTIGIRWFADGCYHPTGYAHGKDIVGMWKEPFNIVKALSGDPVLLRNGATARIMFNTVSTVSEDTNTPVQSSLGGIYIRQGTAYVSSWSFDGRGLTTHLDIIGML